MTLTEFKALPWREQNEFLRPHLLRVLSDMTRPMPTTYVAYCLAERTGLDEEYYLGLLITRRFAEHGLDGVALATHDGEETKAFGKPARRWRWHPLSAASVERLSNPGDLSDIL